jgi:tRNA (guanine37-N1)-methyltransferase
MRFDLITLFPELFGPLLSSGITRRAFETGQVEVCLNNPRDFSEGNYKRVDDRPYGGGPGMVMMAEPMERCLQSIRLQRSASVPVVLFSPLGRVLDQASVANWASSDGAILICGRYEGLDQRFIDQHVTQQISLGDFVMSGGEIAAMALLDAVARLQPGVLNTSASHQQDSFSPELDGLLDCPHYTRPQHWAGQAVPEVLLSGNHLEIERWRRQQRLSLTLRLRPELITRARAGGGLSLEDEAFLAVIG